MAISNTNLLQTKKPLSLPLLAFITFFLMLLNTVNSSDSLSFNFNNFGPNQRDIILQGDAQIPSTNTLQLTRTDSNGRPQRSSVGRALYYTPVRLWDSSTGEVTSFETSFTFVVTSSTINIGDGLAFFIAPPETTIPPGSAGGLLGLFSTVNSLNNSTNQNVDANNSLNQIVAVEFDTYINGNWDPNYRHIGIDVNSIRSSAAVRWDRRSGAKATVDISYNPANRKLNVVSSYPNYSGVYTVSYNIDLKTVLPEWVRIGFSASTGDEVETHNILSWSFSSRLQSIEASKEDMYIERYV